VDWARLGGHDPFWHIIPGTVMMHPDPRYRYPETGKDARLGEDTALLRAMWGQVPIARIAGVGHHYVYGFHGTNTWDAAHHRGILVRARPLSEMLQHRETIRATLAQLPLPRPIRVCGHEGVAFLT
jgi:hypothetical protein